VKYVITAKKAYLALLCLVLILPGCAISTQPDTTETISYHFKVPNQSECNLTLAIPLRDYNNYKEKPRPSWTEYSSMATDPDDDAIIDSIVRQLNDEVAANNLSELKKIQLVLRFVQSLNYIEDVAPTSYDEYPRYPVETLFEQGGDCEDTSILLAAILTEMGYDVALLLFEELDHMGLGINFPLKYGNSWVYDGKRYWYLDTTGGQSIGWCLSEYQKTAAYVYPVSS